MMIARKRNSQIAEIASYIVCLRITGIEHIGCRKKAMNSMRLYQGNAKKLVGKKIDCYRRMGGCYPMEIIDIGGIPYVKDAVGVCMPIPEKEDDFNTTHFDYAFQEVEVSDER